MSLSLRNRAISTNPSDNFDDNFNDAHDTFNKTATTISTAWIVGIVVIVVAVIAFVILGIWFLRRSRRRRDQRRKMEEQNLSDGVPAGGASEYPGGHQNLSSDARTYYTRQMEQHGNNPWRDTPRHEAQDAGVQEASGTTMPWQHGGSGAPQSELHETESGRRELP